MVNGLAASGSAGNGEKVQKGRSLRVRGSFLSLSTNQSHTTGSFIFQTSYPTV